MFCVYIYISGQIIATSHDLTPKGREIHLGCGPLRVTVTTRIVTFLVGDPNLNLHLPLLLGGGHIQNIPYIGMHICPLKSLLFMGPCGLNLAPCKPCTLDWSSVFSVPRLATLLEPLGLFDAFDFPKIFHPTEK